jgi:hypothetical protein
MEQSPSWEANRYSVSQAIPHILWSPNVHSISCHFYAGHLQLYTRNKPCFYGILCCSCSVVTIYGTCYVISHIKYVLYFYISTFHSCVQCPIWLFSVFPWFCSFQVMLLRYFLNDPVAPSYYWYLSSLLWWFWSSS